MTQRERPASTAVPDDRPRYDRRDAGMLGRRAGLGPRFAAQIAATTAPWLPRPLADCDVLDLGCGYGHTALALGELARSVTGVEPSQHLAAHAGTLAAAQGAGRFTVVHGGHEVLVERAGSYDLVVMDNVLEHIADQREALKRVALSLRPGGVLYLLVPNRLWPIEPHYHLPALGWLPLPLANRYLRLSGRGDDFRDASYAPTLWSLARLLDGTAAFDWRLVLPADLALTQAGARPLYRAGAAVLRYVPAMWAVSKALLVVAVRRGGSDAGKEGIDG